MRLMQEVTGRYAIVAVLALVGCTSKSSMQPGSAGANAAVGGTSAGGVGASGVGGAGTSATGGAGAGASDSGTAVDSGESVDTDAGSDAGPIASGIWRTANLTNFESYPDPNSEECIEYNGCTWAGQFAAIDGKQSEAWVMQHDILAVHSKDFEQYKLKTLRLKLGTMQIDAVVYDECADSDCSGCCTKNSKSTGFLIDIEKYTMQRFGAGDGIVQWQCLDCAP